MHLSTRVLGTSIVTELSTRAAAPVLVIGADRFTRAQLSTVGCFNYVAAQRLTVAAAALGVQSTRDLFDTVPPSGLVLPGVGSIALAVLGAAFEAKRIGGSAPLEAWCAKHRPKDAARDFITFHTMKAKEHAREAGETRARKRRAARTHARRNTAHRLRVDRFTTRQNGSASHATH